MCGHVKIIEVNRIHRKMTELVIREKIPRVKPRRRWVDGFKRKRVMEWLAVEVGENIQTPAVKLDWKRICIHVLGQKPYISPNTPGITAKNVQCGLMSPLGQKLA